jgi:hypothetical protein
LLLEGVAQQCRGVQLQLGALQAAILEAMEEAMLVDRTQISSPYVTDGAAGQFIAAISSFTDFGSLLRKPFHGSCV